MKSDRPREANAEPLIFAPASFPPGWSCSERASGSAPRGVWGDLRSSRGRRTIRIDVFVGMGFPRILAYLDGKLRSACCDHRGCQRKGTNSGRFGNLLASGCYSYLGRGCARCSTGVPMWQYVLPGHSGRGSFPTWAGMMRRGRSEGFGGIGSRWTKNVPSASRAFRRRQSLAGTWKPPVAYATVADSADRLAWRDMDFRRRPPVYPGGCCSPCWTSPKR